jgi:adenosylmethionine-8-amino-7-oxononanoate aminotransferase
MQSLKDKDKQYIWHPFTSLTSAPEPIPIVKGEGVYLVDETGNRYIDAISSWWVNIHGHAHPYIAEKIYQQALQLEQVIFAGFTHRPAIELAERLMAVLPGNFSKIFYSDNGSTSTEVAVKMGLQYWWNKSSVKKTEKIKILAFKNSYHGDTFGAMSVSDRSIFTMAFQDKLFDVIFIDTPTPENIGELKEVIRLHAQHTAAFIYEPLLQGAGGMKMYDALLMDELIFTCQQNNIICIADEVMTGFGRTGRLFASEYMKAKPDIICLSKGLTGGTMALGVTACTQNIVDAFLSEDELKTFFHGHSFTANPLACTAALASLDLLQKDSCQQNLASICSNNRNFIEELKKYNNVKNARCLGTIIAFEYISDDYDYLNNISQVITTYMLQKGIYMRPLGNTIYLMPPYCITMEELHVVYNAVIMLIKDEVDSQKNNAIKEMIE